MSQAEWAPELERQLRATVFEGQQDLLELVDMGEMVDENDRSHDHVQHVALDPGVLRHRR